MLSALEIRLRDLIAAQPLLARVPVLIEDKGNIASEVDAALAAHSLAIVVAPAGGKASGQSRGRASSEEEFEIVIHRGLLEEPDAPTTVQVLDLLVPLLHGAPSVAGQISRNFEFKRHELREADDGFARILIIGIQYTW